MMMSNNNNSVTTPHFLNNILKQLCNKPSSIYNTTSKSHPDNRNHNNHVVSKENRRNMERRNNKTKTIHHQIQSRSWFVSEDEWILGNTSAVQSPTSNMFVEKQSKVEVSTNNKQEGIISAFDFFKIQKKENTLPVTTHGVRTIIANTDQSVCPICEEELEKAYDSQRMNWMLSEAEFSPSLQLYVHSNCSNSKKRKTNWIQIPQSLKKVKI